MSEVIVERVQKRVLQGIGLIVLHSDHFTKILSSWPYVRPGMRTVGMKERLWSSIHRIR